MPDGRDSRIVLILSDTSYSIVSVLINSKDPVTLMDTKHSLSVA